MLFCVWLGDLTGKRLKATISHMTSIPSQMMKGNFMLIEVRNGKAMIKNTLTSDTHHLIDEDIFLKRSALPCALRVSCRNAEALPVAKESPPTELNIAPTKKNRKFPPMT